MGIMISICLVFPLVSQANIGVLNGLTHENISAIGETYKGIIVLKNSGKNTDQVRLYQTDFYFTCEGKKFYEQPGKLARSNSSWITISTQLVTLAPGETSQVNFDVKVPEGENINGTYWSIIMVEGVPESSTATEVADQKQIKFGINQLMRYGIQVVTHIGDTGERNIKFLNTELVQQESKKLLQVDVENIGERWLRPDLYLDLYDSEGEHIGKYEGGRWRIYPGTSVRYQVDLTEIPPGVYTALIVLDNNDDYVFGARYNLDLSDPTEK